MKKGILLLIVWISLISAAKAQQDKNALVNKWRIDSTTAMRMIGDRKNCDTCKFKGWKDKEEKDQTKTSLRQALGIARINFRKNWIKGRYSETDETRYATKHGLPQGGDAAKVRGYTTKILRYKLPKKDRMKYGAHLQNSSWRHMRTSYFIGSFMVHPLAQRKYPRPDFEYQKFMYLDFGAICPPPNPCVPD